MRPVLSILLFSTFAAAQQRFDVVVYGGTSAGVIAAVAAAREGATVALLEPGRWIGGMTTGGLSRTDHGRKETIGGYSLEFYRRAGKRYGAEVEWYFEPKVASQVYGEMLGEAGVKVLVEHRLKQAGGVLKRGARLVEIRMENGARFQAAVFVDSTYEGDLMAQARVSYTWGRESTAQYGESLAGVRPKDRSHQFDVQVSARGEDGRMLPEIQTAARGELGAGDRKVQAYNFRMIVTRDPSNRIPFARPAGYDPKRFELLARWLAAETRRLGREPRFNEVALPGPLRGDKIDLNNRGAFSTDYIGKSWEYPEANYRRRAEIWRDHVSYTAGYLYFMATDERVPPGLRAEFAQLGLAKDEFTDNGNWPYQLYVREARRMVGEYVMVQKDLQTELTKPDVVGMGSYNSDSHNVQRFVQPDGAAQNEGNMEVSVKPYQIPYRILTPKKTEAENLLAPVCFSASHVTYSSLRMEPVYMIMGHAAGVAAKMAVETRRAVQDIDIGGLQRKLKSQGAVFEWRQQ
ncbi:MAG: FAD-dependent oxidoreductase [Candidatus Solibacter usitatus]|nr:FAD-dependent oxidoreductase [Candidatus Solibacter usitatus]